ncbi:MAG: sulfatase-like hydrolase/transferase [Fimbriimonadaceae bacterium]|nr:sulfatase-like hydrolase/transferase [Fimbriimonadaceae bacterium]
MAVSRREFLGAAGSGLLAAAARRLPAAELDRPMPNLLWIMTDQQPVSTLRSYGNPVVSTPVTDRLAARGMRLGNFHLSAFPCGPSRTCLLTGREAHSAGVTQNDVTLPADVPTIAELLRGVGYDLGYFGKYHLAGNMYRQPGGQPESNWQRVRRADAGRFAYDQISGGTGEDAPVHGFAPWAGGWATYHQWLRRSGQGQLLEQRLFGNHAILPSGPDSSHAFSQVPAEFHVEQYLAGQAADFVRQRAQRPGPFGAILSFYAPHHPVAPPQPWHERYTLEQAALPANHRDDLRGKPFRQRQNSECYVLPEWSEEQFRGYVRRYWGYCGFLEQCAAQVLQALDDSGRADDTIVLWTSDHGDMVAAHGMIHKLGTCGYEELLNVPLLLSYPGRVPAGSHSGALCATVDLVPTLLDLIGLPRPAELDGRSFGNVLRGSATEHREAVVCNWMEQGLVVRTKQQKLVFNHSPRDLDEVYDLVADPGELHNLAPTAAGQRTAEDLHGRLGDWLRQTHHPYAEPTSARRNEAIALVLARPKITSCRWLGGDQLELAYEWAVEAPLTYREKCWCYAQFVNPALAGDASIAFRNTTWPDPPTPQWQAGQTVRIGPLKLTIPAGLAGVLQIRLGLYDPEARRGPGQIVGPRANNNAVDLAKLRITRTAGAVTAVELLE